MINKSRLILILRISLEYIQLFIIQLSSSRQSSPRVIVTANIFAFAGTMSEESYDQDFQLSVLDCQRFNLSESFRSHQVGHPSFSTVVKSDPYVAIRYRLGIEQHPNEEIWSCDMSATKDGFSVVSKRVIM